jgi:hypothetical protein
MSINREIIKSSIAISPKLFGLNQDETQNQQTDKIQKKEEEFITKPKSKIFKQQIAEKQKQRHLIRLIRMKLKKHSELLSDFQIENIRELNIEELQEINDDIEFEIKTHTSHQIIKGTFQNFTSITEGLLLEHTKFKVNNLSQAINTNPDVDILLTQMGIDMGAHEYVNNLQPHHKLMLIVGQTIKGLHDYNSNGEQILTKLANQTV